ncbi:DUF3500 domain-containing protein [Chondrinema litorale]|uniref:DUF3500 domain-containing protein n=1 Tax=Chondrinema litorale TaxID=2994555 RepID=UPI0025436080|nr:DUF3500 domain-containing protein [Chondrinema litorale]UZR98538.1 DUF3500 domain-containing protein [Chondrinema litorale]
MLINKTILKNRHSGQTIIIALISIFSLLLILSSCEDEEDIVAEEEAAAIGSLDCSSATISDSVYASTEFSGTVSISYTGGNGVAYDTTLVIASTGVTGYTATLESGTLADGAGSLIFDIAGIADTPEGGTAYFSIVFGGQACVMEMTVTAEGMGGDFPDDGGFPGDGSSSTNNGYANVDPVEVASCSSYSGIEKIVCIAEAFKALLDDDQLEIVQEDYSLDNAKRWSNLPEGLYGNRLGLSFGEMDSAQVAYAKALLVELLGTTENEGWDELRQHLIADNYLNEAGGGDTYGAWNYYLTFLGTPSTSGTFEIQFGGHHWALTNTYTDGVLSGATPSFRGIEPYGSFTYDGETYQTMNDERDAFSAMLNGLSSEELATAELSGTYGDIIVGPQNDDNFPTTYSGIKVGNLTSDQKELVLAAIRTYVDDLAEDDAEEFMTLYESELDDTYIAYSGTTTMETRNDYVRIDGPSVWIEASIQNGVILSDPHPHTIWRDKTSDYGGN